MGMPLPSETFASRSEGSDPRSLVLQLSQERKKVDDEIQDNIEVLRSQGATMTSALVDPQGFPLATTDIVAVRTARARIIALRNDREGIEGKMRSVVEAGLARKSSEEAVAATLPNIGEQDSLRSISQTGRALARMDGRDGNLSMVVDTQDGGDGSDWRHVGGLQAFARVDSVADSSPAQLANLLVEDEILSFAGLDGTTAHRNSLRKDLGNLPSVVQEGKEVVLVVLRKGGPEDQRAVKRLRLTPASGWGGRGLLGCHIVAT